MQRMSVLDAAFLDAEDEDPHASLAIASIAVLEGPAPSQAEFAEAIAGRLPLIPRYRQKARELPLDIARPVWVDDPDFDISYHLRRTALAAPGGDEQLCDLMGRVMSQRLDRDHPLWEYWVVEGLAGGRWAVISKVHHCMVDGVSGTDLYRVVMGFSPEPPPAVPDAWSPEPEPSTLRLATTGARDLLASPLDQARALVGALRSPRRFGARVASAARGLLRMSEAVVPVGGTSLSGAIGRARRYGVVRASLADVAAVKQQFGGTTNDVALSVISEGFRQLLLARGERPTRHRVRTLVPVSVRAPGEENQYENRVSCLLAFLPVDVADPVERLGAVRRHLAALKSANEAEAGEAMTSLAVHEPFPPIALGLRLVLRLPQRNIVTVTTNVPGPRAPLYMLGRRVVEVLPYVPIATTVRFGVSIFTYCGRLTFGLTGDYDTSADIRVLARGIESGLADLVAASERAAAGG